MGNYVSCALSAPLGKQSRGVRVIFPTGEIRQLYQQPLRAAELMLETPNFFLVNSKSLHLGRRFSALTADEELEPANFYVFFPMRRLNSVVTAPDVGLLFLAAQRVSGGNVRILREPGPERMAEGAAAAPRLSLEEMEEEFSMSEFRHRLSLCRSKKPLLETIAEEPDRLSR